MKNQLIAAAMAAMLTLASGVAVYAQIGVTTPEGPAPIEGPSLQQTLDWIANKTKTAELVHSSKSYPWWDTRDLITFEGCNFKVKELRLTDNYISRTDWHGGSLVDMDARQVTVEKDSSSEIKHVSVMTETLGAAQKVLIHFDNDLIKRDSYTSQLKLNGFLLEDAESLRKGLRHAIVLCQADAAAKKQEAAAARAANPKDLF